MPTLTLTPDSTSTPMTFPTLSVEHARVKMLELLFNNGNCRLPCLWGITPGKSTYQEAQRILTPFDSVADFMGSNARVSEIIPVYTDDGNLRLYTRVAYLYSNNIVNRIGFTTREEKEKIEADGSWKGMTSIFDSTTFGKRVEYYSLAHVLSEQGIPDSVMIAPSDPVSHPDDAGVFYIAFFYPNQGIWVNYTTSMHVTGNIIKGCPENAHIEMNLYPSGDPDSFFAHLKEINWWVQKDWYKPIEEATSMTLEQFYETFRQPTEKCIETPSKLWYVPNQ